ncbi:hypothetical protein [uncultured Aquimarina sp.]|uniref:hypothetical protein n=1 Tax=uncultured Aquimarina sp. TaxID=575652 RepID=UPI002623B06E|nr:hypothetical protein [uncultured Aquimarina sp.]
MKNLFVLPVLAFGLLLGTQNINAQETFADETVEVITQEKYIELAVENLPQPVLDAVAKDFAGATISKAAAKEDASEFKLELTKEDGETVEVLCDAEGNWIGKS